MKKIILTIICLISISVSTATEKEIVAKIVFENFTENDFSSGKFFITELNKTIKLSSEDSFTITLPESGKYQFGFYSEEFDSYTYYPARITSRKNIITIRLQNKGADFNSGKNRKAFSRSKNSDAFKFNEAGKKLAEEGMNFIFNGLNNSPANFSGFKEKYGIGIVTKNCVVDPITFKESIEHNIYLVNYLNQKFGEEWRKDLPAQPFGVR